MPPIWVGAAEPGVCLGFSGGEGRCLDGQGLRSLPGRPAKRAGKSAALCRPAPPLPRRASPAGAGRLALCLCLPGRRQRGCWSSQPAAHRGTLEAAAACRPQSWLDAPLPGQPRSSAGSSSCSRQPLVRGCSRRGGRRAAAAALGGAPGGRQPAPARRGSQQGVGGGRAERRARLAGSIGAAATRRGL